MQRNCEKLITLLSVHAFVETSALGNITSTPSRFVTDEQNDFFSLCLSLSSVANEQNDETNKKVKMKTIINCLREIKKKEKKHNYTKEPNTKIPSLYQ